jgi:lipoate-protein ligase A
MHAATSDPYFNLATEEHLLKCSDEDYFILWQSDPVIVVGKHQNTFAEINYQYVRDSNIRVARRLTGGGTVYHDHGNINFTFIRRGETGKLVDFVLYIEPVIGFLKTFGIEAHRGVKNEMLVKDRKVSGNAEHVYKNRVLHHGTLLFNADIQMLEEATRPGTGKYTDKAVHSNRSTVMNLTECLDKPITIKDFQEAFMDYMLKNFNGSRYILDDNHNKAIQQLAHEKYRTWEWIYGWSPDYEFENTWQGSNLEIIIQAKIHRGIITSSTIRSQGISPEMAGRINDGLTGILHEENSILANLELSGFRPILTKTELRSLVLAFFC